LDDWITIWKKLWGFLQVQEILGTAQNLMHRLMARATIKSQQFCVGCVVRALGESIGELSGIS